MPRVIKVDKARKDHPEIGVKKGEPYYYWTFKNRFGPGTKVKSKTYPKASQLTRSEFASQYRAFAERIAELNEDDGLWDALQEIAADIRTLGEEQQDKLDNMPEGLQQGSTGELLEQRADACNTWADEIEGLEEPEREDPAEVDPEEYTAEADDLVNRSFVSKEDFMDALWDAAWAGWERYTTAVEDAEQQAEEDYNERLSELKSDAADADPGEP